jgi:hypothetical protein
MHSRTWTLAALLFAAALPAGAAEARVAADDSWCREGWDTWNGRNRRERWCEVREAELQPQGAVHVDARPNGGIEARGWDRAGYRLRVRIIAVGPSVEEARALAAQVKVETPGAIRAMGPDNGDERRWWASFRLDVPRDADLDLEADNGGLHLEGISGHARLSTLNGGIHLDGVGGQVEGSTTNGGVHVNLSGTEWRGEGLDVSTTNGGVHMEIPSGYNARLLASTVNGGIHSDLPVVDASRRRSGGRIETDLGRGGTLLKVRTTNGGLHISQE